MAEKIKIDEDACIGCGLCSEICGEHFEVNGSKATVKQKGVVKKEKVEEAAKSCPVEAIKFY